MENAPTYADFKEYDQAFAGEVQRVGEGFVRIGYMLRVGLDTDIIAKSEYKDVWEYAEKRFHIDKSQASRFININKRFSKGGYADVLDESFQGYGVAKLGIMLQLPDTVNEQLSPEYTKAEIKLLKEELDEEQKTTELEILMEGQAQPNRELRNMLEMAMYQLLHDEKKLYEELWESIVSLEVQDGEIEDKVNAICQEILAPAGESIRNVRIQGIGRIMISVKGTDQEITVINMRSGEKESFRWSDMYQAVLLLVVAPDAGTAREAWSGVYGEEWKEDVTENPVGEAAGVRKAAVAPVQQKKKQDASRAYKARVQEQEKRERSEPEEEIPGQDNILNHTEWLPSDAQETESEDKGSEAADVKEAAVAPVQQEESRELEENEEQEAEGELSQEQQEHRKALLWDNIADGYFRIEIFFKQVRLKERVMEGSVSKERMSKVREDLLAMAAGIERIIDG